MFYTFARVGAVVAMRVDDYYQQGKRWFVRLHEKGGKHHTLMAHHKLEEYLDAYIQAAGLGQRKKSPLFPALYRRQALSDEPLWPQGLADGQADARKPRAFRSTTQQAYTAGCGSGITEYLRNGGSPLRPPQEIAAHEAPAHEDSLRRWSSGARAEPRAFRTDHLPVSPQQAFWRGSSWKTALPNHLPAEGPQLARES